MTQTRAFLDVDLSLMGRRWVGPAIENLRLAEAMAQETHLPMAICQTLVARGVEPAGAAAYLAPQLRDLLPDPMILRDMGIAATRFLKAVHDAQRIAIFADYDVDGGSSAALLIVWLAAMGRNATLYIPDRIDEGYGPNVPAMQALGAVHDLIICVDVGGLHLFDIFVDRIIIQRAAAVALFKTLITGAAARKIQPAQFDELNLAASGDNSLQNCFQQLVGIAALSRTPVERHHLHQLSLMIFRLLPYRPPAAPRSPKYPGHIRG